MIKCRYFTVAQWNNGDLSKITSMGFFDVFSCEFALVACVTGKYVVQILCVSWKLLICHLKWQTRSPRPLLVSMDVVHLSLEVTDLVFFDQRSPDFLRCATWYTLGFVPLGSSGFVTWSDKLGALGLFWSPWMLSICHLKWQIWCSLANIRCPDLLRYATRKVGLVSFEGFEFVIHVEIRPIRWIGGTEGGLRFCEAFRIASTRGLSSKKRLET